MVSGPCYFGPWHQVAGIPLFAVVASAVAAVVFVLISTAVDRRASFFDLFGKGQVFLGLRVSRRQFEGCFIVFHSFLQITLFKGRVAQII